jgi:hypothetical protein
MWGYERIRLLKNDPWDATDLAQELFAMDLAQNTVGTDLGNGATTTGPIVTNDYTTGDTLFQVNRGTDPPFIFTINDNGQFLLNDQPVGGGGGGGGTAQVTSVFPGNLIGYSGSNLYTVTIYPDGLSATSQDVAVLQLGGDPTVPHLTDGSVWTMVTKNGSTYYMTLPVWQ